MIRKSIAHETITLLFTDIVDSTATQSRLAPDAADRFRVAHFSLLRGAITVHGGEEVKNLGDGVMAAFTSPSAGLAAAVAMQQAVDLENRRVDDQIGLRVGLSTGEVHREEDDYFGAPVIEAARLCARCEGGQILCSALVKALGGRRATQSFSSVGELPLKGLPEPVPTLEVHWEPLPIQALVDGASEDGPDQDVLERGRASFRRKAWGEAHKQLSAADQTTPLEPEDLARLATAAYLLGYDDECTDTWARAHRELVSRGDPEGAVRCAFWLAFGLIVNGAMAPAEGWLARAGRLLEDGGHDCVEQGYLLLPGALGTMFGGDPATACTMAAQAAEIGERYGDANVLALARLVQGSCMAMLGEVAAGFVLLDEVMVAVTSDEVSPILAGLAYCALIANCNECFDVRRAREWTAALSRWCACQPDLVAYRGQCLVHRSEIQQMHGEWPDARAEAQRACERLGDPPGAALGMALHQRAELHRLSGELAEAEESYRQASEWGHEPQPGLALLRLAQGQPDAAAASLRLILGEPGDPQTRARLLAAHVEILLVAGDVPGARADADELSGMASAIGAPLLAAVADHATGAVLLAEDDPRLALATLRRAGSVWRALEAPYETARSRVLIAEACRALGDEDTAAMELGAARRVFEQLGAAPDVTRVDELLWAATSTPTVGGLTPREVEVLALIACGKTNREIAAALIISEHTVARHVQNIFAKLDVTTRAAAGAFAHQHGLA